MGNENSYIGNMNVSGNVVLKNEVAAIGIKKSEHDNGEECWIIIALLKNGVSITIDKTSEKSVAAATATEMMGEVVRYQTGINVRYINRY